MKNLFFVSFLATTIFFAPNSHAKKSHNEEPATEVGLGLSIGWTSGFGFAYRQHFDNYWGVHVSGGAFGLPQFAGANVGVQVMRTFSADKSTRFYGFLATSATYGGSSILSQGNPQWSHQLYNVFGAGIGLDLLFADHVSWSIELPLAATTSYNKNSFEFVSILPIPSTAVIYYF